MSFCTKIVRCSVENKDVKVSSMKVHKKKLLLVRPRSLTLFSFFFFIKIREKKWRT